MAELSFETFCSIMSKLSNTQDKKILENYINSIREYGQDTLYIVMKLLLPDYDKRIYNVKRLSIGKYIINAFSLNPNGTDARYLMQTSKQSTLPKDYGLLVYDISKKLFKTKTNNITLSQIDTWLTDISNNKISLLYKILPQMTSIQHMWFIKILLKDMKWGKDLHKNTILDIFHPNASAQWVINRDLHYICKNLTDITKKYNIYNITLNNNLTPMLCSSLTLDQMIKKNINPIDYVLETKLDGERLVVHYSESDFTCFSRNGHIVSNKYLFVNVILSQNPDIANCILDGEIVRISKTKPWNIIPKGDVHVSNDMCEYRFVVFDILYHNDEQIFSQPLEKRIKLLQNLFPTQNKYLSLSNFQFPKTSDEIVDIFNSHIDKKEEGIVLKNLHHSYKPGYRNNSWYKMKPEYENQIADDLDLIVLGGYYTSSQNNEKNVSSFLVGYLDKKIGKYMSLCNVSNGISVNTYKILDNHLRLHAEMSTHFTSKHAIKLNIDLGKYKPDIVFDPNKSCILVVRAASVCTSDHSSCGMNLRFPRVINVRFDKYLTDTTIPVLSYKKTITEKKLISIQKNEELWLYKTSVDESKILVESGIFKDLRFCIPENKDKTLKQKYEEIVYKNGGKIVQVPTKTNCDYIVTSHIHTRVQVAMNTKLCNVVKYSWIEDCVKNGTIVKFTSDNCFFNLNLNMF